MNGLKTKISLSLNSYISKHESRKYVETAV